MLTRKAAQLQVLHVNAFCLQPARGLAAQRALVVDVWGDPTLMMPTVRALTGLVTLSIVGNRFVGQISDFNLQPLASLTSFKLTDITPMRVQLPTACNAFKLTWAGPSYHYLQLLLGLWGGTQ